MMQQDSHVRLSRRFRALFAAALALPCLTARSTAVGQDDAGLAAALAVESRFVRVIEMAEPSVVGIARMNLAEADRNEMGEFIPNDFGSGVIIAPEHDPSQRLVLTNLHVAKGGPVVGEETSESVLDVYLFNRRRCRARIVAADPRSDLAVLQLDLANLGILPSTLTPMRLGTADHIKKGQLVLALGNPYGLARDGSPSASWGIISNISRKPAPPPGPEFNEESRKQQTIHHLGTLLQIDARLNLGTSGGALLNLQGELVGLTTSLAALDGYETSAGFAVPMDAATRRVIDTLALGYEVEYGFLGVEPEEIAADRLPPGFSRSSAVRVGMVLANSPARMAGIHRQDFILAVNSQPIYTTHDLMREVGKLGPGTIVGLQVLRWPVRGEMHFKVLLGKWPVFDDEGIIATSTRFPSWRGLTVDYPTARWKYYDGSDQNYHEAVLVTQLEPEAAGAAGLRVGDLITHVNRAPVSTPAQFHAAVRGLEGAVRLRLVDGRMLTVREPGAGE